MTPVDLFWFLVGIYVFCFFVAVGLIAASMMIR